MKKNYISNSPESVRMFKRDFLEALSKVHFTVPLFVFLPVAAFCIYESFKHAVGLPGFIGLYLLGVFIWTFTEYFLHRFVFHYLPAGKPRAIRLHFIIHGVHHDYPNDAKRLVMPPSVSIPLAAVFFFLFKAILPAHYLFGFFSGFISGYLFYDMTHYALHHFSFKGKIWKKIKRHHMQHHYQDPGKGFGVSSPFWDKIFKSGFNGHNS